jgi:hypothetical protein
MKARRRWLPSLGLMLLLPIHSQAQERRPLREWTAPVAVTSPVAGSRAGAPQTSSGRSGRDSLVNGTVIGAAVGAAIGMGLAYATRDSVLGVEQYSYAALVFGGIGAGVGVGIDALLNRNAGVPIGTSRRLSVKTRMSTKTAGLGVTMRW